MKPSAASSHGAVSPCLLVDSIPAELEFLKAVFGAAVKPPRAEHQRSAWQVEVQLGNATLMIGRGHRGHPQSAGTLYVWANDVDATYARAVKQGATLISAPTDQPSGLREAGFKDPQGNIWWIGREASRASGRTGDRRLATAARKKRQ